MDDLSQQVLGDRTDVPVCDVAGVMDPHQLVEALAPPGGKLQPHMEGAFSLGSWVLPAEPSPLVLGYLL